MKISQECIDEILSLLDYLKESGVPCSVTLYYLDKYYERTKQRGVHINLNKIPMDILNGDTNFSLYVRYDRNSVHFFCYFPLGIQVYSNVIKEYFENTSSFSELMTNYTRKTRLKDILSDPNPPKEVPV